MSNDTDVRHDAPTRRDTLKYGAAVAAGLGLAGCSDFAGQSGEGTPTGTGSYTVEMAPMGEVEFDGVPETAAIYDAVWADHLVALGQQDRVVSLGFPDNYYTGYYDQLPGVTFDTSDLTALWNDGLPEELFYELDADVHHLDPCRWLSFDSGWSRSEFDDIESKVGPFFCNRFSRAHSTPPEGECRENYQYYSVWELAEKFSQVYQVQNRGEKLRNVRDEMVESISDRLPPESERPTVALVVYNAESETFGAYEINGPGFAKAHYRPLEPVGAFAGSDKTYANSSADIDLEQMLDIDPDVIVHHWDIEPSDRFEALLALEDDPVGKELTAIRNDRVYVGGTPMQGPIFNLFQLETAAQQIYPDEFGEFRGVGETPAENELFDRERVADILDGEGGE
ncbi:ABC transporter substrate-binding protein [Haloarcula sp. S1CR25-12]|uniref:ABC transporter substrate-binding protein n=1 Tax=Haloarcula saliterrae TaxID=2950534 RepID=A0ABU2FHG1_9EURY|nr:ABC transporter substrate-binding protein [Haloarcula sp. S1CR25-12]MDS0261211.1 ABC transporter substrate-binding protein [Haloarcula sp. S1CR25-12]